MVNYLHMGKTLDLLSEFQCKEKPGWQNGTTPRQSGPRPTGSSELTRLIRSYIGYHKKVNPIELLKGLRESAEWRERFQALGCRGFSYVVDFEMRSYDSQQPRQYQLAPFINLRLALLPNEHLFYPNRVAKYFRHVVRPANHYIRQKMPSIAICFGMKTDKAWYVFVMQSDLASKGISCVREHFRGWRNILFANVVAQAIGKVSTLYLCRARDIERACYPGTKELGCVPERWKSIYDHTAKQWGMRLVKVAEPVQMQIYRGQKPVCTKCFYELSLAAWADLAAAEQEKPCTGTL